MIHLKLVTFRVLSSGPSAFKCAWRRTWNLPWNSGQGLHVETAAVVDSIFVAWERENLQTRDV
jgi:hypothetical protein